MFSCTLMDQTEHRCTLLHSLSACLACRQASRSICVLRCATKHSMTVTTNFMPPMVMSVMRSTASSPGVADLVV
jgi:hypothetical protein